MSAQSITEEKAPIDNTRYKWEVLLVVMVGTLMAALDTSIVNVSIPAIMADFGAGLDSIEWVVTGYMLAFATLMPLTSWLSTRIGHKQLYVGSLVVFTLGSLLCGMAWNTPSLVVARVIQAMGGGALTPTGMAIIADVFEPHERGRAMGYWGVGVILGPAFGPTLGGYLTDAFGWPSIFLINLPIGIFGVWATLRIMRPDKPAVENHKPFDYWGFAFLSLFLLAFLFAVSRGEQDGWTSPLIIWCGILSVVGLTGFMLVETHIPYGIMDLSLFKYPIFSVSMVLTATRSIALFGGVFLLPVYLQQVKGLNEIESGLILLPGSLIIALFMPLAGFMSEKVAPRYLALLGLMGLWLFMFLYRDISADTSNWDIIYPTFIRGFGIAFLMAPLMATTINSVPRNKSGMASSIMNIVQQVAGALGIAILAMVLANRSHFHFSNLSSAIDASSPAFQIAVHNVAERAHILGYDQATAGILAKTSVAQVGITRASEMGFQDAFMVGAFIVLITILPALLLPGKASDNPSKPMPIE